MTGEHVTHMRPCKCGSAQQWLGKGNAAGDTMPKEENNLLHALQQPRGALQVASSKAVTCFPGTT